MADKSFAEVTGSPAIENKKRIAREDKLKAKQPKHTKEFFTVKDGKVVRVKFKPNGAYSVYVATKAKMKKGEFDAQVKTWKKDGLWIAEEDYQDRSTEIITELQELSKK